MESEASSFEASEMLASFMGSTPLPAESWRLSNRANRVAPGGFVAEQLGAVGYVAFSGVPAVAGVDIGSFRTLVPLPEELFQPLCRRGEGEEEPAMVQAGVLHIFTSMYNCPDFQHQLEAIMQNCKSLVITGHSIGGAVASLTALWLLSYLQSVPSTHSVLCITFGSPLLGNKPISRAVLREQWAGNFCHIIGKHDIVPRLVFTPLPSSSESLHFHLQFWQLLMTSLHHGKLSVGQLPEHESTELFHSAVGHTAAASASNGGHSTRADGSCWPFGNHLFCSEKGAVCLDNAAAIVRMLHLTMATGSAASSIEDHLRYGEYVISMQLLQRSCNADPQNVLPVRPSSSYEAGLELALQSSGIATDQGSRAAAARDCLKMARQVGRASYLNSANLAIVLAQKTPYRAEIEWYKTHCDESEEQLGYYDSFKLSGPSKRYFKVNMNRVKLGQFWDQVIEMLDTDRLPHDFLKRAKWVNASQFYKLLVEPLEIAEYYRSGMHRHRGHYLKHGRERRFELIDKWWREREGAGDDEAASNSRSRFASLTQDSCFWARLEEAREWLESARKEGDPGKSGALWESIDEFERYARRLVGSKEVSKDVVAKNSSYSNWVEEWRELKSQVVQYRPHIHRTFRAF